jgi:hypothetical protein
MKTMQPISLSILLIIFLAVGCFKVAPAPSQVDVTPVALSPKGQTSVFDQRAWEAKNIISAKLSGRTYTSTLTVPANFISAVQAQAAQAVAKQPKLQTRPVWIASSSQLVKSSDIYKVTPELVGIFEFAIEYETKKIAWGVKAIINLSTWQIIQWQANTVLTPGYVPLRDRIRITPEQRLASRVVMFGTNQYSLAVGTRSLAVLGTDLASTVIYNENGTTSRASINASGEVALQQTGTWQ